MKKAIDKDWLYQQYITENKSWKEIGELIGVSASSIGRALRDFKIVKTSEQVQLSREKTMEAVYGSKNPGNVISLVEKRKATNLIKYGFENPLQSPEVKAKIKTTNFTKYGVENPLQNAEIYQKGKATLQELYGVDNALQSSEIMEELKATVAEKYGVKHISQLSEVKEKKKSTTLKNHGVENPFQSSEIKDKIKETMIKNYGVASAFLSEEVQKKIKHTNVEKYGFENPSQSPVIKQKVKASGVKSGAIELVFGKTINEWAKEYDIPVVNLYAWNKQQVNLTEEQLINHLGSYQRHLTDVENQVCQDLGIDKWNKKFHSSMIYHPDFKLSETIALNVDGLFWHSELKKASTYHFKMREEYEALDLRIFQFRADEVFNKMEIIKSMVNNALGKTPIKVGARKTQLQKVSSKDAEGFLEKNHIKGKKNAKHYGLYYQGELISLMSYKRSKDFKAKQPFLKIERFCSKVDYNVVGAFNKLLKPILIEVGKMPVHYWVDLRYGTGKFLLKNGFKLKKETLGWEWTDFTTTYNRLKCRANMDNRKLSEKAHAAELGWVKIFDAGQRVYVMIP